MKILMVNKFLYPNGGSETYIFKLGQQLEQMGHQVQFFGMEHEGRIVGNQMECYTSGMDFHSSKLQKFLYPFKILYSTEAKKKIIRVLEGFKPQVVHLNNFNFQLTPSILYGIRDYERRSGEKIKVIFTAHDSQLVCPNHLMQRYDTGEKCQDCLRGSAFNCTKNRCVHGSLVKSFLGSIEGYLYRKIKTYRFIDQVISPSYFMKEVLSTSAVLKDKIMVMHNFVDKPVTMDEEDKGKKDYVLYFGRYSEEKGIRTLLKVCEELPDIPFVFIGSGPLEEKVNRLPNVENRGFLIGEELYEGIRRAKFSVFTSECYENCPFAVMEAQMYGTPVIGANIGGVPELIAEGQTGELFESGNASELRDKIKSLWENEEKINRYTKACQEVEFDSLKTYCDKLLQVYS
ncbi:glycosyltransferase family 4 protein [Kineothrix sp. MB12-C1]|uniref:glycosyltransferase family 4 protein n=1 Tax=Kineothrix sp. MB12-C1 TaxID=3070215 RepID=UPI0027D330FC|nr:glycosyltransferase family 4 protein [Kineothrix sp. MB12-C1]WMC91685.1 glycosyltransferase family 4 protein [Kineothrix sp. MB12-C1]